MDERRDVLDRQRLRAERRSSQRRLYTVDQLLGRRAIRLRRRTDKVRLVTHVTAALALFGLTAWWVLPQHTFAGPVLWVFAPGRGVHIGDLPSLAFVAVAVRSLNAVEQIVRRMLA